ncbi:MAG TPA: alkaline phosphatase family protein [Terriglobales bacterium]|nr:alkaline phosphatase family protein [Terriglobales bacterium]
MNSRIGRVCAVLILIFSLFPVVALASAYNARPKLVVIIIIDQFRGDYLQRYYDDFGPSGFRLLMDHGAYFSDCYYDYANTRTAPGHATLLTGAYSNGHGILSNEWWDQQKKREVTSVEDDSTHLVGASGAGASPHNLLASTLGDELKLATQGKARVFGIALKDRASVLPAGWAADGAYWIEKDNGAWITSSYYRDQLPAWVQQFNQSKTVDKYWNKEIKDSNGNAMFDTARKSGATFYDVVGSTPLANDYELEFARALIINEKLGSGSATDLLTLSLSANDILGHEVGPDSPKIRAMALALDRQLAGFFDFLGKQFGLANVWMAFSADHGSAPLPSVAKALHIPAAGRDHEQLRKRVNQMLTTQLSPGHPRDFVSDIFYPNAFVSESAFTAVHLKEEPAEQAVGEALERIGMLGFFTRAQLARGDVPATKLGRQYLHSYSPYGGWYVLAVPPPFTIGETEGTDHGSPYSYDTHVPLAFFGVPFRPGVYHEHAEPTDLAPTLASLLGVNAPTGAAGHVLTQALAQRRIEAPPEVAP